MFDNYICPITLEPFHDPVFLIDDGFTYERRALETWLKFKPQLTPMGFKFKKSGNISDGFDSKNYGIALMRCAVIQAQHAVIDYLVELGINPNQHLTNIRINYWAYTLISDHYDLSGLAASYGNFETVVYLLKCGLESVNYVAVIKAIEQNDAFYIDFFIRNLSISNLMTKDLTFMAKEELITCIISHHRYDVLDYLIQNGFELNLLFFASSYKYLSISDIEYLSHRDVDISQLLKDGFFNLCRYKKLDLLKLMAQMNLIDPRTAAIGLSHTHEIEIGEFLFQCGIDDVEHHSYIQSAFVFWIAVYSYSEFLISHGVDFTDEKSMSLCTKKLLFHITYNDFTTDIEKIIILLSTYNVQLPIHSVAILANSSSTDALRLLKLPINLNLDEKIPGEKFVCDYYWRCIRVPKEFELNLLETFVFLIGDNWLELVEKLLSLGAKINFPELNSCLEKFKPHIGKQILQENQERLRILNTITS